MTRAPAIRPLDLRFCLLAVDDLPDITEMLAALLAPHEVVQAASGTHGMRLARARSFDLYVVDYYLPDVSGEALCRSIRCADPHAPILVYSARAQPAGTRDRLWSAWVQKDGDTDRLCSTVDQLLAVQVRRNESAADAEIMAIAEALREQEAVRSEQDRGMSARIEQVRRRVHMSWTQHCEREVRLEALRAYVSSGGTRASFDVYWKQLAPAMIDEAPGP